MQALRAVAAILLLLSASCNPAALKAWPIPELTLPSSAVPARMPSQFTTGAYGDSANNGMEIVPNENSGSWGKGFNYALGWDSLVRHVDGQLKPQGYSDYSGQGIDRIPAVPGYDRSAMVRAWQAPDGRYNVMLMNVGFARGHGAQGLDGCDYLLLIDRAKL